MPRTDRPVYTYIITRSPFIVKIGKSDNPVERLASLQTATHEPLHLVATIAGDIERRLHEAFADRHLRGEWFKVAASEVLAHPLWAPAKAPCPGAVSLNAVPALAGVVEQRVRVWLDSQKPLKMYYTTQEIIQAAMEESIPSRDYEVALGIAMRNISGWARRRVMVNGIRTRGYVQSPPSR